MAKKMLIDATHPEETRVVVVDGTQVDEFDFETASRRQLAGNIYLAKVTRVEPSLQAAFVDYGGNRHGFLAFAEIHPDYYQIPAEDRQALIEEERAAAAADDEADARDDMDASSQAEDAEGGNGDSRNGGNRNGRRRSGRGHTIAEAAGSAGSETVVSEDIPGMGVDGGVGAEEAQEAGDGSSAEAADAEAAGDDRADDDTASGDDDASDDDSSDDDASNGDAATASDEDDAGNSDGEGRSRRSRRNSSRDDDNGGEAANRSRRSRARRYKIQEVIRVRQIMLVQVVKEERGNKGAALTTYLSLAGRYCVLMPNTARGGGISRKITNIADRKKLREIAAELQVPLGAGLIIRTAGSQRTRTEIRRDYEYLMRLWEQIRELTFKSVAPAPIYEEGDLIKRSIRDLYSKEIDEVLVEGERGYRTARDFMTMIMPSHARNVKHYTEPMSLFARYQVESYLAGMFNPVVQLKSGGYIVIGVTEALIAIDVNSGRATREGSIEDTAYKTNCEAADEVARQLRLRDLAGLIVIDFIDMDERKNNAAVEKRFKERLKSDRARIQVGHISGFGLLELSRQRLHPGMVESTTQPCPHCHGTGLIRSNDSLALAILRSIDEEGVRKRSREVLVKAPVVVANFLINQKRDHIAQVEARTGMSVMIEADPSLISPDWTIERFKTTTRNLAPPETGALSVDADLMAAIDDSHAEDDEDETIDEVVQADGDDSAAGAADSDVDGSDGDDADEQSGEGASRASRRRRRRRRRGNGHGNDEHADDKSDADESDATDEESAPVEAEADADTDADTDREPVEAEAAQASDVPMADPEHAAQGGDAFVSASAAEAEDTAAIEPDADASAVAPTDEPEDEPEPASPQADAPSATSEEAGAAEQAPAATPAAEPSDKADEAAPVPANSDAPAPTEAEAAGDRPKRRGWWSN